MNKPFPPRPLCDKVARTLAERWLGIDIRLLTQPVEVALSGSQLNRVSLDLFFREFDFQRQWAGDAVGQVRQSNEHMQVYNLLVGKMFLEFREIGFAGAVGRARKLFGIAERDLLGRTKSRVGPLFQS